MELDDKNDDVPLKNGDFPWQTVQEPEAFGFLFQMYFFSSAWYAWSIPHTMLLQPATTELIPSTTFSGAHLIKLGPFTVGIRAGRSEGLVLVSWTLAAKDWTLLTVDIANLRYPAKKINSLLANVDIPIDTKRLKD